MTGRRLAPVHRKLFKGGAEAYTELCTRRLHEARAAGIEVGVIAVLHQASLDAGPERFYHYFADELGLDNFQVNTPFPGGPASKVEGAFHLNNDELAEFFVGLFDVWIERGYASGVSLGPFDALIHHFTGAPARLACIWKENCSNQFISVDSKGTVAQCDWMAVFGRAESYARKILHRRLVYRLLNPLGFAAGQLGFVLRHRRKVRPQLLSETPQVSVAKTTRWHFFSFICQTP